MRVDDVRSVVQIPIDRVCEGCGFQTQSLTFRDSPTDY